jgi:hypothetical protein
MSRNSSEEPGAMVAPAPASALPFQCGGHELAQLRSLQVTGLADLDVSVHLAGALHQAGGVGQVDTAGQAEGDMCLLRGPTTKTSPLSPRLLPKPM